MREINGVYDRNKEPKLYWNVEINLLVLLCQHKTSGVPVVYFITSEATNFPPAWKSLNIWVQNVYEDIIFCKIECGLWILHIFVVTIHFTSLYFHKCIYCKSYVWNIFVNARWVSSKPWWVLKCITALVTTWIRWIQTMISNTLVHLDSFRLPQIRLPRLFMSLRRWHKLNHMKRYSQFFPRSNPSMVRVLSKKGIIAINV